MSNPDTTPRGPSLRIVKHARLLPVQYEALALIRDTRVTWVVPTRSAETNVAGTYYYPPGRRHQPPGFNAGISPRMIREFERGGLIEKEDETDEGDRITYLLRITDAGRVALGDWAAGEES